MKETLITPDMSCNHCKITIENAVKGLQGVRQVNADPGSKKVTVEYDEKSVNIEMIRSAIEDAGYSVKR